MAYSRWSNSNWYAFWKADVKSIPYKKIHQEMLALWYVPDSLLDWSYKTLKDYKNAQQLTAFITANYDVKQESDISEAIDIIYRWLDHVEGSYKIDNNK